MTNILASYAVLGQGHNHLHLGVRKEWHVPDAYTRGAQRRRKACEWFASKWRMRASEVGVQAAAKLMRKQGVPVDVAVSILATR